MCLKWVIVYPQAGSGISKHLNLIYSLNHKSAFSMAKATRIVRICNHIYIGVILFMTGKEGRSLLTQWNWKLNEK